MDKKYDVVALGELLIDLTEVQLKEMLTYANAAVSIITTRKGAIRVMPTRNEIDALIH